MRVARETYVLLARFRGDTANWQKGGAARLPLLLFDPEFALRVWLTSRGGGGDAYYCCACDCAGRVRRPGCAFVLV